MTANTVNPTSRTTEITDLGLSRALHEPSSTMMNGASYTARMHGAFWLSPQTMPLSSIRPRQQADCQRGRGGKYFCQASQCWGLGSMWSSGQFTCAVVGVQLDFLRLLTCGVAPHLTTYLAPKRRLSPMHNSMG